MMHFTGRLEDGTPVVGGWFYLVDTHGLHPDDVRHAVEEREWVLDGDSFLRDAVAAGWNRRTAFARLGL